MSAEGNLYNPGIFNADDCQDKEKVFPRVDVICREYFEIVKCYELSSASRTAMKSHLFKILRPFLPNHTDIRASLALLNAKSSFDDYENKVIIPVENVVKSIFQKTDIEEKDAVVKGDIELWGGSYYTVPYWRCQPYFRPVNGVTADKRIVECLKRKAEIPLESTHEKEIKV